jgi:integrase/recombinase XerD
MKLNDAIEGFLESRRIDRGAADLTIDSYRRDLLQLASWLPPNTACENISLNDLNNFLASLRSEQKPTSIARKTSALRQFFKYCCLEHGLRDNPTEQLNSPGKPQTLPKFLTNEQVTALLAAADSGLHYGGSLAGALKLRDRAMIYLLYATGLRVSELISLETNSIDTSMGFLRVCGKGGKERLVPFAPIAGERLLEYRDNARPSLSPSSERLFIGRGGEPLTRQAFWKIIKKFALLAGLNRTLSPHVIRHSFATHLLQSGINLRSLQALLGHSDLSTTQIYTHVSPTHLKDAHRKFHPRGE